jgi:hypothetical protein
MVPPGAFGFHLDAGSQTDMLYGDRQDAVGAGGCRLCRPALCQIAQ